MLTPVSTSFVVVRFDTGKTQMGAIIEAPQSLVISFFGEDTDHGGTKNVVLRYGLGQFHWICF